mmetsp:Transcript_12641/g.29671  ORF Transcript_12641/g.29671 Transcript_12641/m.29671 type:complete len:241 (-) Transcript_12641:1039-1761(-)
MGLQDGERLIAALLRRPNLHFRRLRLFGEAAAARPRPHDRALRVEQWLLELLLRRRLVLLLSRPLANVRMGLGDGAACTALWPCAQAASRAPEQAHRPGGRSADRRRGAAPAGSRARERGRQVRGQGPRAASAAADWRRADGRRGSLCHPVPDRGAAGARAARAARTRAARAARGSAGERRVIRVPAVRVGVLHRGGHGAALRRGARRQLAPRHTHGAATAVTAAAERAAAAAAPGRFRR